MELSLDLDTIQFPEKATYFLRIEESLQQASPTPGAPPPAPLEIVKIVTDIALNSSQTPKFKIKSYKSAVPKSTVNALAEQSLQTNLLRATILQIQIVALTIRRSPTGGGGSGGDGAETEEVLSGQLQWNMEEIFKWFVNAKKKSLKVEFKMFSTKNQASASNAPPTGKPDGTIKCTFLVQSAMEERLRTNLFKEPLPPPPKPATPPPPPPPVKEPTPEPEPEPEEPEPEPEPEPVVEVQAPPPKPPTPKPKPVPAPVPIKVKVDYEQKFLDLQKQRYGEREREKRLVDKLLREIDNRTLAIKHLGEELVRTREDNLQLKGKLVDVTRQVRLLESTARRISSHTEDLNRLSQSELLQRYVLVANAHQIESTRTKELQLKVEGLQESLIQKNDVEKKFLDLRAAHAQQQAYVQKLQEAVGKLQGYKNLVKRQEMVIRRLEATATLANSTAYNDNETSSADMTAVKMENQMLKDRIASMERSMNMMASAGSSNSNAGGANGMPVSTEQLMLLMRAEQAEAKVAILEQQMMENAKTFAKKLASYKQAANMGMMNDTDIFGI